MNHNDQLADQDPCFLSDFQRIKQIMSAHAPEPVPLSDSDIEQLRQQKPLNDIYQLPANEDLTDTDET